MNKKYIVRLTDEERNELAAVIKKLKGTSQKVRRAQILLKADADGPDWTDHRIAEAFGCRTTDGREHSPASRRARLSRGAGRQEACDAAGREVARRRAGGEDHRHASRAAAPGLCQLDAAAAGSQGGGTGDRRVGQSRNGPADAKKNGMTNRKIEYWVIPPEADGEFVANMEEVLETYAKPYDPDAPGAVHGRAAGAIDQGDARADPGHPPSIGKRVDYEYERAGTANIFMFTEPLAGWREVAVRETKTKVDWAIEMARLLEGRYAECEKVISGLRQSEHAHQGGLLRSVPARPGARVGPPHRVLSHAQARQLAEHRRERTEFHDTPVRGRSPHRRCSDPASGNRRLVNRRQQHSTRRRLANEDRRRPLQTQVGLP